MSVSVYVEAHRTISKTDLEYLVIYNGLIAKGIEPPKEVIEHLRKVLGDDDRFSWNEEIIIPPGTETVAVSVRGEGNVEYGEGMIVKIADLPPGTVALRIYMS